MVDASKPTIGYWKIRGLGAPIKYLFEYLGVEYNDVQYEQGDGPEFSRECWNSVKHTLGLDFPNNPYLIHGDLRITESHAIMRYIANKWGSAELSGKTPEDKARIDMLLSVVQEFRNSTTGHFYGSGDRETIKKIAFEKFQDIAKFLGEKEFVAGNYVTFVDFFIWEQIELFTFVTEGEILARYPNLLTYHKRVGSLPKFAEYIASDRFMVRPFNNKVAKINN